MLTITTNKTEVRGIAERRITERARDPGYHETDGIL